MQPPSANEGSADGVAVESIGAYLAHHRELRGITMRELAELTRIPLRSIERLESGAFDHEIDGFVRGFVRTVSDALGLDTDDTLQRLLREPGGEARMGTRPRLLSPSVLGLSAAALAGLLVLVVALQVARSLWMPGDSGRQPMLRRDPVRALAEAQGFDATLDGARLPAGSPATPPEVSSGPEAASGSAPAPAPAR